MSNQQNKIKVTSIILLIQTVIWLVFTGFSMSQTESTWTCTDYVKWAANPDMFFIGNYINATLLTITAIVLYAFLYDFLKNKYESYADLIQHMAHPFTEDFSALIHPVMGILYVVWFPMLAWDFFRLAKK